MSSTAVQPKVFDGQMHLLTPTEKDQLALEIAHGLARIVREDLLASAQESFARGQEGLIRGQEGLARGQALAEEARIKKAQGEALIRSSEEKSAQADEHARKAAAHEAKAAAHEAAAAEARAGKERIIKILSVNVFFGTFHGQIKAALPPVIIEKTFERYLDQGRVISVDPDPATQKAFYDAVTTLPFARYLAENPGKVTQCNFTLFRNIMDNMRDVAQILAQSTCSVKAVWISSGISGEAKANLEAAKLARGESLTIKYV